MTVQEIQAAAAAMAKAITVLVQEFEAASGCHVHSIPVTEAKPTRVSVKVQIPNA